MSRKQLITIGGILFLVAGLVWPVFNDRTNCGGNSAALARIREYALHAHLLAFENSNKVFQVTSVPTEEHERFTRLARYHWIPQARFLVSTSPISLRSPRRIIVACDTPFSNFPRRLFGSPPPTHAVGYSDGTGVLISPEEFAKLDRASFAYLDELHPAK